MHKISIPKQIIDSCIKRRGKVHVFEKIDLRKTVLLVIDMQNSWLVPGMSSLEIPMARSIIPNINQMAESIRTSGGIVAWTKSTFNCPWTKEMYAEFSSNYWINRIMDDTDPKSKGFELHAEMDVKKNDIISIKYRPSAFIQGSSDLDEKLKERNFDTLIICGTLTNACCESTARDAVALGYKVVFVSDGTATRSDLEHNSTLINLIQLVADVRPTKEVLQLIKKSINN